MDIVMMEAMDIVMVDTDIVTEDQTNKFSKVSICTFWQTH